MSGGLLWEPASAKEAVYYDTIFEDIDLDKSGTLDSQEAVKFLSLSGLTKSQLKVRSYLQPVRKYESTARSSVLLWCSCRQARSNGGPSQMLPVFATRRSPPDVPPSV